MMRELKEGFQKLKKSVCCMVAAEIPMMRELKVLKERGHKTFFSCCSGNPYDEGTES